MTARHPLTISLTPELADFVATEVRSGLYGSASEVVRAGLRLLASRHDHPVANAGRAGDAPRPSGMRAIEGDTRRG